ncbi:ubiquinone biosynthesis accessory factor UbiJ [Kangiella shandongensis]|uniref:ubiquinone biosynthesis accessory factor UbiJ n=1 Tax=Kangiella shandongensis TaxID=2763258 RepID=UPI001CBEE3D1|nr:SCP2 sterol-binding domain-containing protein [Kangiella shandongensis]
MLFELLAPTIETVINKVVKLDPEALNKLDRLEHKVIAFHFTDIEQRLFFIIDEGYILVKSDIEREAQAELSGNLLSFFNLASNDNSDPIFKGEVRFSGEISTAQSFQNFFNELDIDWEEHLSQYIGDIAAYQFFKSGKSLHQWLSKTANTAQSNFSESLRFEAKAVPASIELENFYDDIADLKSDVERFAMRVERLYQRQQQAKES